MNKNFTTSQIREIGAILFTNWEKSKNEIKLSGKSLYALISLKKDLEQRLTIIEETVSTLALQFGAEQQEDGSLVIPQDRRAEAGQALMEMGNETLEVFYEEIVINDASVLPIDIYEALFDFIRLED